MTRRSTRRIIESAGFLSRRTVASCHSRDPGVYMNEVAEDLIFPENFLWGTATSAHQIEGNNTMNQWWAWEQTTTRIADGSKSGRACRHYEFFAKDLDIVEILGLNCHRFSVEWSRIEPEPGVFNDEAFEHYEAVLRGLHERELATFVTLHHFTLPQWFEDAGGWLNPEAPDRFSSFARKVADRLGHEIDYYITMNEPMVVANASYLVGAHPPGHADEEEFAKAAVNLLYSHAKAVRAIREAAGSEGKTNVGITKAITVYEAVDPNNSSDIEEKERRDRLLNRWFLDSLAAGRALEPLGANEPVPGLPGSCDFVGVNYYLRARVSPDQQRMRQYYESMRGRTEQSDLGWEVFPEGMRQALQLAWELRKPLFVTANGIADHADRKRAKYIISHLSEIHAAIRSGIDVRGYMHWTLLDDFEWALGYMPKFGLASVTPETYKRVLKKSAMVFKEIAVANTISASLQLKYLQPRDAEPAPAAPPPESQPAAAAIEIPQTQAEPRPGQGLGEDVGHAPLQDAQPEEPPRDKPATGENVPGPTPDETPLQQDDSNF